MKKSNKKAIVLIVATVLLLLTVLSGCNKYASDGLPFPEESRESRLKNVPIISNQLIGTWQGIANEKIAHLKFFSEIVSESNMRRTGYWKTYSNERIYFNWFVSIHHGDNYEIVLEFEDPPISKYESDSITVNSVTDNKLDCRISPYAYCYAFNYNEPQDFSDFIEITFTKE